MIKTLVLLISYAVAQTPVTVSTGLINGVAHLEFHGRENWNYDIQRLSDQKVSLEVERLDEKSIVELKMFQNAYITKVEFEEGKNNKHQIIFSLANKDVRAFEYLTDQPSRLIVDFYKDQPVVAAPTAKKRVAKLPAKNTRKPAGTDFLVQDAKKEPKKINVATLDGSDPYYERFKIKDYEIKESAIIGSKLNLYIHFPMMSVPIEDLKVLNENPTVYEIPVVENNDENKKARLLLTLFNKQRNTVFLKALDLFKAEFPETKYKEDLAFMEADIYYRMWLKDKEPSHFDKATTLYTKALLDIKNSNKHERTHRFLAYAYMDRLDYLAAFTSFQRYLNHYPDSSHKYSVKLAMAECMARLNNTNDAVQIFEEIEGDKNAGVFAVEAAFRKADVLAQVRDYSAAIKDFDRIRKKYSEYLKNFPSAFYNRAESKFWLNRTPENLHESLNDYISFIEEFPKNEHANYAMERIGELLEMLGAPKERYEGALLETIYRYPESQGAGVAKIRLLRQRIPDMKEKDIDDEIAKVDGFIQSSNLEKLKEFKTIMISDGYYEKKEYDKTLNLLLAFYQENPLSNYLDIFKKRIVKTFRDQMLFSVSENDFIKTFQIYGKNAATWFKDEDRLDIPYILGRAFEKSGVPDEAILKYQHVLNKLYSIKGTQEEKERAVFENIPSTHDLNLRLASVFVFKKEFGKALDNLKEIDSLKLPNEDLRVENVYLSSVVNEKLNNVAYAIQSLKELTESWRGNPEKISGVLLRLAMLQNQTKKQEDAISSINKILTIAKDSDLVDNKIQIQAYELKAQILLDMGKNQEAIASYRELLEKYESTNSLYSSRYKLGKIHFDNKEIKDAEKVWSALQGKPEAQLWDKLAQENLKSFGFRDEYKKYVDRIPAMANEKKGEKK